MNSSSKRGMPSTSSELDPRSREFLDGYQQGLPSVLENIYREHINVVAHVLTHGFVTRTGGYIPGVRNPHSTSDLCQEVFLKAFSPAARRAYDARQRYRPYLLAIARNALVDDHRRAARNRAADEISDLPSVDAEDLSLPTEAEDTVVLVEAYLAGVPCSLQKLYQLRFVSRKSQQETANALGITRQNLRTLERMLKDGLRKKLSSHGFDISSNQDRPISVLGRAKRKPTNAGI